MKLTESQALLDDDGKIVNGKWELNGKHQIVYHATGAVREEARLIGTIVDTASGTLSVEVTGKQQNLKKTGKVYRLKGRWRLDAKNRIQFEITRTKTSADTLRFKNTWTINQHHEVIYSYLEEKLKTKRNITRTLTFKGYWDISEKNRLTYYFLRSEESNFKVRGAFQTQSIFAKKGEIRYQFGIEVEKRIRTQKIALFGKWKHSRKLGLYFEMEYRNQRSGKIRFGGEYRFDSRNKVEVNLTSVSGEKLGAELVFSRAFLKTDGEIFIKLFQSEIDSRVEGGVNFRW